MFGKKKNKNTVKLMHYEGLVGFSQDYPCTVSMIENVLTISKIKPDLTVTLKKEQVNSIDVIPEENFMARYHGHANTTSKMGKKWYYVFSYVSSSGEQKYVAFWNMGGYGDVYKWKSEITSVSNYQL